MLAAIKTKLFDDAPSPSAVGRYQIVHRIGQGAMGIVYLARDPQLDRDVALKLMHANEPTATQTLLAEAHALAKLSHPNVVAVYDAGVVDHVVYIAMEYVSGRTLRTWIDEERHSTREVIEVMLAAGRGLASAHAAGMVHRDFKPANVIVGDDGRVRVLDFGLARRQEPASVRGDDDGTTPAGTPAYMAPEQRIGDRPTALCDQYSYCVTFHEALTQQRPARRHAARGWQALMRPIISRGLRIDPTRRHASIDVLIRRFERRRTFALVGALMGAVLFGATITLFLLIAAR